MHRNLIGSRTGQAPQTRRERRRESLLPQLGFAAAMVACAAAWITAKAMLPPDAVMPMVGTLLLILAGVFALIAWRHGPVNPNNVTYRDVAGALTLIGLCAAAMIDSEQMMRLAQLQTGRAD
jgi:hypothetical protein